VQNVIISVSNALGFSVWQAQIPSCTPSVSNRAAFLGDRALTTTSSAEELDDVPSGSLYRHGRAPTKAGVLQVVAERRVRRWWSSDTYTLGFSRTR